MLTLCSSAADVSRRGRCCRQMLVMSTDEISFKPGLTRTHVALAVTREMFKVGLTVCVSV